MLTKITLRNFKRFEEAVVDFSGDIGAPVVLIGPNNSGKTTALQSLALWRLGLITWMEKRGAENTAKKRPGVTINRRDITHVPVPGADMLWRNLKTHRALERNGRTSSSPVRIEIEVEGIAAGNRWTCGFEFDYGNEESFSCRPLRVKGQQDKKVEDCEFSVVPAGAAAQDIAFLPPMSGLASVEARVDRGRIDVLIGEGQTAHVIRNLCYEVYESRSKDDGKAWKDVVDRIRVGFGVTLNPPEHLPARGEIRMSYRDERDNCVLDLSAAGRGLQQVLLLLAYMHARPKSVLLLDEPDAHLEILRQRSVFQMLTEVSQATGSQVIAASHSEVILEEAAERGVVIAFIGKPHRANDKASQVLKALKVVGFADYLQAELKGWVLYLEGATDLAILRAFATKLRHADAIKALQEPFVHYMGSNRPQAAREHFFALLEAAPNLVGIAQFDRIDAKLQDGTNLRERMWKRREIENYLLSKDLLMRVAQGDAGGTIFEESVQNQRRQAMTEAIEKVSSAARTLQRPAIWSHDAKASDEVLEPIFMAYAELLGLTQPYRKRDFHELVTRMEPSEIDDEVRQTLDAISQCSASASHH